MIRQIKNTCNLLILKILQLRNIANLLTGEGAGGAGGVSVAVMRRKKMNNLILARFWSLT